jgi:hypothetical protein
MSFNWADFLTLANALVRAPNSPGPEEASLRSAISRHSEECARRSKLSVGGGR